MSVRKYQIYNRSRSSFLSKGSSCSKIRDTKISASGKVEGTEEAGEPMNDVWTHQQMEMKLWEWHPPAAQQEKRVRYMTEM